MIQYTIYHNKEQFTKDYKSLVEEFKSKFYFIEIDCKKEKIKWPKEWCKCDLEKGKELTKQSSLFYYWKF